MNVQNARVTLLLSIMLAAGLIAAPQPGPGSAQGLHLSLRAASDLPVATVSHDRLSPRHSEAAESVCDKDIDPSGSIAGVSFVAAQDNGICTSADIDVYENGGDWYVAQAGGEEAAFTITRIAADGTPTLVVQLAWVQSNTYTPDIKAFKQGTKRYIALALERLTVGNAACGVVIVDVTNAPVITTEDIVDQVTSTEWCDVHNVFVEEDTSGEGRYLYLTADFPNDMRVLDLVDLNNIIEIGRYTHPEASAANYVHDITVIDHGGAVDRRVYVSYWNAGLMILDAADVTPGVIESGSPNQPLNPDHSIDPPGFLTHHAYPNGDGSRVFIQDEFLDLTGEKPVQMWNIESPNSPTYVDGIALGSDLMPELNPAHNLLVEGDLLYAGWYKSGLQAFRFSNDGFVSRPIYHQVQTEVTDAAYDGAWGVRLLTTGSQTYVVQSDRRYGLIVDGAIDSDGDGFSVDDEVYIGTDDADPCGTGGWPADLVDGVLLPNGVNIEDLTDFIVPNRYLGTDITDWPDQAAARRHDLDPGKGPFSTDVNIVDLTVLVVSEPPMLQGERNFGSTCPLPP